MRPYRRAALDLSHDSPQKWLACTTAGSDPTPLQRHPLLVREGTRHRLQTATNAPPHQATRHSANAASRHIPNKQRHCARSRACPHRISGLTANVALKAATEAAPCPQLASHRLCRRLLICPLGGMCSRQLQPCDNGVCDQKDTAAARELPLPLSHSRDGASEPSYLPFHPMGGRDVLHPASRALSQRATFAPSSHGSTGSSVSERLRRVGRVGGGIHRIPSGHELTAPLASRDQPLTQYHGPTENIMLELQARSSSTMTRPSAASKL